MCLCGMWNSGRSSMPAPSLPRGCSRRVGYVPSPWVGQRRSPRKELLIILLICLDVNYMTVHTTAVSSPHSFGRESCCPLLPACSGSDNAIPDEDARSTMRTRPGRRDWRDDNAAECCGQLLPCSRRQPWDRHAPRLHYEDPTTGAGIQQQQHELTT